MCVNMLSCGVLVLLCRCDVVHNAGDARSPPTGRDIRRVRDMMMLVLIDVDGGVEVVHVVGRVVARNV